MTHGNATPVGGSEMTEIRSRADQGRGARKELKQDIARERDELRRDDEHRRGRNKLLTTLGILVLAIVIVCVAISGYVNSRSSDKTTAGASIEDTTTADPAPDVEAEPVVNHEITKDFVIKLPPRDSKRLNSDGVEVSEDPEAFRRQIAEQAAEDPLTLWVYYMASILGEKRPLENEAVIAKGGVIKDGNVYSERGVEAYNDWLFLWELADIESVKEVTFQGYNTGVDKGKVTKSKGIGGPNKAGYDITYRDVSGKVTSEHSALERCTQPTLGGPVSWAPDGLTDSKGENPYPDSVATHTKSLPVPSATSGHPEGNAEKVTEEQQKSSPGNRTPTNYGTDSASKTNSATNSRTTNSDGSTTDATIGTRVEVKAPSEETVPPDEESGFDPYATQ